MTYELALLARKLPAVTYSMLAHKDRTDRFREVVSCVGHGFAGADNLRAAMVQLLFHTVWQQAVALGIAVSGN